VPPMGGNKEAPSSKQGPSKKRPPRRRRLAQRRRLRPLAAVAAAVVVEEDRVIAPAQAENVAFTALKGLAVASNLAPSAP